MRRFESIVMSETEPTTEGILWLRKKNNSIEPDSPGGFSIWWFGEKGWQPLYDLDTRYDLSDSIDYSASSESTGITTIPDLENGLVTIVKTYSVYNGNRTIGSNANFVNETGLKKHVDDLQFQISNLKAEVSSLKNQVKTLQDTVNQNTASINALNSRVSNLENNI